MPRASAILFAAVLLMGGAFLWQQREAQREQREEVRQLRDQVERLAASQSQRAPQLAGPTLDSRQVDQLAAAVTQTLALRAQQEAAHSAAAPAREGSPPKVLSAAQRQELGKAEQIIGSAISARQLSPDDITELRRLRAELGETAEFQAQVQRIIIAYNRNELKPPTQGPPLP